MLISLSQQHLKRHAVGAALGAAALNMSVGAAQATLPERAHDGVARGGARFEHQGHRLLHAAQGLEPPLLKGAGSQL